MGLDDVLDDGESETSASGFPGARLVNSVETLEDPDEVL
jgi:hypothetical protein